MMLQIHRHTLKDAQWRYLSFNTLQVDVTSAVLELYRRAKSIY